MTPTHLAAYIARGPAGLPAFDLPAVLDALKAERAKVSGATGDDPPTLGEPAFVTLNRAIVNRLDAAIAEIEFAVNPCLDTAVERRRTAVRVVCDVLALVEKTTETP